MSNQTFTDLAQDVQIDGFTLDERLGYGSSGEVWRAHDAMRQVAIKFMNLELITSPQADRHRARFHNEVKALEKLANLPNVPTLYGYNFNAQRPYLVMAFINAPSWSSYIQSGELMSVPLLTRLSLLEIVAETLTEIHRNGIIHRDVKPANIHGFRQPFLIDFSVAIEKQRATQAAPNVGTGLYMPPADGLPPDEFTDSFAFVLTAYEVMFGMHAVLRPAMMNQGFREIREQMRHLIAHGNWNKPSTLTDADMPVSLRDADHAMLDTIFAQGIGPRQGRYTDLLQFVADLRNAVTVQANVKNLQYTPETVQPNGTTVRDYTLHEVRRSQADTNHPAPSRRKRRGSWSRTVIAVLALVFFWLAGLAVVFVVIMNR